MKTDQSKSGQSTPGFQAAKPGSSQSHPISPWSLASPNQVSCEGGIRLGSALPLSWAELLGER